MKIGFIGAGIMGSGVAANILRGGHEVTVWSRRPETVQSLVQAGARLARTAADTLQGDLLFSMLAHDQAIRDVGLDGPALKQAAGGLVHVNLATISVSFARELSQTHLASGLGYVAAPVFGRSPEASSAQLLIVASGADDAMERVMPVLALIGSQVHVAGRKPEAANLIKIAGNAMLATVIESLGESFALVRKGGIDPELFYRVITSGPFSAPSYKRYGRLILDRAFEPAGFPVRLGLKDIDLALTCGTELRVPLPLASLARDHFLAALSAGMDDQDWVALAELLATQAGLPVSHERQEG